MTDIVTVTGNIASDPELKRTSAGVAIATFRVASSHRRFDRVRGAWVDSHTNFYTASAFRGLGEHAFASLRKGDRVVLSGRLRIRNWETQTTRGTAVEIDVDSIGHDLLWGTTTFQKDQGGAGQASGEPADDGWSTDSPPETTPGHWPVTAIGGESAAPPAGGGDPVGPTGERDKEADLVGAGERPF